MASDLPDQTSQGGGRSDFEYRYAAMTGTRLPVRSLTRTELIAIDCLAAALLSVIYLTSLRWTSLRWTSLRWPSATDDPAGWTDGLILLLIAPPVAVRRVWPRSVFGMVAAASVLALMLGVLPDPFVASALAAYPAAATKRPTRRSWWTVAPVSAVLLFVSVSAGSAQPPPDALRMLLPGAALVGAMWTLGVAVRERRAFGEREIEASRAILENDCAPRDVRHRDLQPWRHRGQGQKGGTSPRPADGPRLTGGDRKVSRTALADMRQALHMLRSGPADQKEDPAEDRPYGMADIRSLIQQAGAAGLDIHCRLPDADDVPAGVARSAYRIVQEALTNVIKHSRPTRCDVTVRCGEDGLFIDVCNDTPGHGRPAPHRCAAPAGYGLIGVRERVAMHGGEVAAAERDDGGYQLRVRLPYRSDSPSDGG
jgi:hypothetical protein